MVFKKCFERFRATKKGRMRIIFKQHFNTNAYFLTNTIFKRIIENMRKKVAKDFKFRETL